VGESADSARAEVLAAQAEITAALGRLDEELLRLEASARAAVDIKTKIRRNPVRTVGTLAGTGFVLFGGPRRVVRRARHAVFGKPNPLPPSMLPQDIDAALRAMGEEDGERLRGALERDFARYLRDKTPEVANRDLRGTLTKLLWTFGQPIAFRYGVRVANSALGTDRETYAAQLDKLRQAMPDRFKGPRLRL
jgi:hypothetical protein